jgi:hypothetical protein
LTNIAMGPESIQHLAAAAAAQAAGQPAATPWVAAATGGTKRLQPQDEYLIAKELFRLREMRALKAHLPDAAFAQFLLSMQDVGDVFEELVASIEPQAFAEARRGCPGFAQAP